MSPKSRRYGARLCEFALGIVRMSTLRRDRGRRIIPYRGQQEQGILAAGLRVLDLRFSRPRVPSLVRLDVAMLDVLRLFE
jgi:hypothetical protein